MSASQDQPADLPRKLTPAQATLVTSGAHVVKSLALSIHLRARGIPKDELIAIGNLKLVAIVGDFDAKVGTFEAFVAKPVRGAMMDHVRKTLTSYRRESSLVSAMQPDEDIPGLGIDAAMAATPESERARLTDNIDHHLIGGYVRSLGVGSEDAMVDALQRERDKAAIFAYEKMLEPPHSTLLKRFYWEGRKIDEIALELGVSGRTVRTGLQQLRDMLLKVVRREEK